MNWTGKTYRIEITKIGSYEFDGLIDLDGIMHEVYGEIKVDWDDDICMPQILYVNMKCLGHWIGLNMDRLNIEQLEDDLSQSEKVSDWHVDRISSAMDQDWDMER